MRSRLGFGLSMAFDFDYYLVDEVMAVGDARFKEKCFSLFREKHEKSNFLIVSHSLNLLKEYCDEAIYFGRNNHTLYYKDISLAIDKYRHDEKNICLTEFNL